MFMKYLLMPLNRATLLGITLTLIFFIAACGKQDGQKKVGKKERVAPVEVSKISQGPITLRRSFNGSLEARAEFVVSPKVSGRVVRLAVNLADTVKRGQVVAELDDAEFVQAVVQAKADLAVAKANLVEAGNALQIAEREFERVRTLMERGVASESRFDTVSAERSSRQAQLEISKAQMARAEALLETARIRIGYTKVRADWSGGDAERLVAERYVDEGHTVSANGSLLLIVELDPITGVIFVTEEEYARLRPRQTVALATDAYAGEEFAGVIDRISPIFRKDTRQARVELTIENPGLRLKPGMFIRVTVELERIEDAVIVEEKAITRRDDKPGVFIVSQDRKSVIWKPVKIGIREAGKVQVTGEGLSGLVVSLGHHLIEDGSAIVIPNTPPNLKEAGPR